MELKDYLSKKVQRVILIIDAIDFSTKTLDSDTDTTNINLDHYFKKIEEQITSIETHYIIETPETSGDCFKVLFEDGYNEEIYTCIKNIIQECENINKTKNQDYKVYFKYTLHIDRFNYSNKDNPLTVATRLNGEATKYVMTLSENFYQLIKDDVEESFKPKSKNFKGIQRVKFYLANTCIKEEVELDFNKTIDYSIFHMPFQSKGENVVGLEKKIDEVHESFSSENNKTTIGQVATFEGMGGLGKTQLAVEYVHKYKESYKNVIWLTIDQDINEQFLKIIDDNEILGKNAEQEIKIKKMYEIMNNLKESLLIFDNTENEEQIKSFYPSSISNKILITSRDPIQGFKSIPLSLLNDTNSKKLLEIESNRKIEDNEQESVDELIIKLDGLPLALEMAGAYVNHLSYDWNEYYKLFEKKGLDFLEKSKIKGFTKHESNLSNTLSISEEKLKEYPLLIDIINILSYGANEPIDKKLLSKLLDVDDLDLIEPIKYGLKLKYFKENTNGYNIHRLLSATWKKNNTLKEEFITKVCNNLITYMKKIKDEFLYLDDLNKASIQAKTWQKYTEDIYLKAGLINYSVYPEYHMGKYKEALSEIEKAITYFNENEESIIYAELLNNKAFLLGEIYYTSKLNESRTYYEQAIELRRKIHNNSDNKDFASLLSNSASNYKSLEQYDLAESYYKESLSMLERLSLKENCIYSYAVALKGYGHFFQVQDDYINAQKYYDKVLILINKLYKDNDHPLVADILDNYGGLYKYIKKEELSSYTKQALKMRERIYKEFEHNDLALSYDNWATLCWNNKKYSEATEYYQKAYNLKFKMLGINNPRTIDSLINYGECLLINPITRKKGQILLSETKNKLKNTPELTMLIDNVLKEFNTVNRNKSKRKKRKR